MQMLLQWSLLLYACAGAVAFAAPLQLPPMPSAPTSGEAALALKCRTASFARRPAGQMATAIRDVEIKRCIKNGGLLY